MHNQWKDLSNYQNGEKCMLMPDGSLPTKPEIDLQ